MIEVQLGQYRIGVATDFGPRVTSLRLGDGPEVLAALDDECVIEHAGGVYRFRGGHRLWAAPEIAATTYANEDHRCDVEEVDGRVVISAPADEAGITKEIAVKRASAGLLVEHTIRRSSAAAGGVAAWAITQFPPGGVAILPLLGENTGSLPNRQLVFWPYTSLPDDRLELGAESVRVRAEGGPNLKIGSGPSAGRTGYFRSGLLFTKELVDASAGEAVDLGATSQVFVGPWFCELETVSGLVDGVDEAAHLTELWCVSSCPDIGAAEDLILGASRL